MEASIEVLGLRGVDLGAVLDVLVDVASVGCELFSGLAAVLFVLRKVSGGGNRGKEKGSGEGMGTGNGERGTGNGERGTGNGERGTGNGERGTGNGERGK
jgi:hypothetical protein